MRLIRGAPGSGKTAAVFREFKAALRDGVTQLRIVVPTATLVRHFQHELARDGVVFPPRSIVSLNRFVRERAAPVELAPDGLLLILVRDALQQLKFPEFERVAATEGMAATVAETIALFENAACTPDKLAAVRKLGTHGKPFEKLWRTVSDAVSKCGYRMRGDLIRAAAANTEPLRVWMDGFLNFTPVEQEFVRGLAKTCDLTLTMTDSPATDEIRRLALQLGAEDRLLPGISRAPRTTVIRARTLEREGDEIARRIVDLRGQGTAFRQIGVALRDATTYVPLLKGTFDRFGIPARFYFGSPLRKHPAAIFLSGVISSALDGWEFEGALATLRAHPRWGKSADFDRFEFAVREAMPGRGADALLSRCESDWLRGQLSLCVQTETWKDLQQRPAEWVRRCEALAENLYRPGRLEIPRDHTGIETERSHVAAMQAWIAAMQTVSALPDQPVSLAHFWRAAAVAAGAAVVRPADDRADVVHVMNVFEARQWDVATLFVCGMTDRDFPRQHGQNLLFPDADIDRLRAAGVLIRKPADHEREERWLFESLRTRAAQSLFLSYPDHDPSGKSVQRSRLLLDIDPAPEPARACKPASRVAAGSAGIPGRVAAPQLHAEMARLHQTISLTALEDLAQCRFKFFGGRTLGLKGRPESPAERLQPRVTGSILHVALERWLADKGRNFVELFDAAFDEACRTQHLPAGYRLEVERIQFREIAERVSANDLWTPDSSDAEVDLVMEFPGAIKVRCRIDRIDKFGDDCVIVDYKSSKTANVQKLVASKTRLQGPLYALAVRENLNLNPVAMLYWAVREDERYGWGSIPNTSLAFQPMPENWTTDAKERTIERLSGFLAGEVHAHPEETEQCRWCDFAAACRVEQEVLVTIQQAGHA